MSPAFVKLLVCWEISIMIAIIDCRREVSTTSMDSKNEIEVDANFNSRRQGRVSAQNGQSDMSRGASSYCHQLSDNSTSDIGALYLDTIGEDPALLGTTFRYSQTVHTVLLDTFRNNSAWQHDYNGDTLIQFENLALCLSGTRQSDVEIITPPDEYKCYGNSGPAVHDEKLYCNRRATNSIMVYDLRTRLVIGLQQIPDAGDYTYFSQYTGYIDVMTDQRGFWALYGSLSRNGILTIQKFDPDTLIPLGVWYTEKMKNQVGYTFMIEGILYCINTYSANATVTYAYSTLTSKGTVINDPDFSLNNMPNVNSLDYNHRMNLLLSWQYYNSTLNYNSFYANSVYLTHCI